MVDWVFRQPVEVDWILDNLLRLTGCSATLQAWGVLMEIEFILIAAAHFLADYGVQTEKLVARKRHDELRAHFVHVLHFGLLAFAMLIYRLSWGCAFSIVLLMLLHFLIDWCKCRPCCQKKINSLLLEAVDQGLHLLGIAVVLWVSGKLFSAQADGLLKYEGLYLKGVAIVTSFVLLTRGATIWVKALLPEPDFTRVDDGAEVPNLGRMIGNLERLLMAIFIVTG